MKTNDKDIEKMAVDDLTVIYVKLNKAIDLLSFSGIDVPLLSEIQAFLHESYTKGFKACEAKMLAGASDWVEYEKTHEHLEGYLYVAKEAFIAGAMSQAKRVSYLEDRIKKLEFMIENGLGWEDMKSHVTYPNG
jgi:hypothetical protein